MLHSKVLALPKNIRLGWKGLPGTNALAYYEKFYNIGHRSKFKFKSLSEWLFTIKYFFLKNVLEARGQLNGSRA
jgi:hypothetical protein